MTPSAASTPLLGAAEQRMVSAEIDDFAVPLNVRSWSTPSRTLPRFGDLRWDVTGLDARPRGSRVLDFEAFSPEWSLISRELLYWQGRGRNQLRARLHGSGRRQTGPLRASSLVSTYQACRTLERASNELGIGLPVEWTVDDGADLRSWVRERQPSAKIATVVCELHRLKDVLTLGGPAKDLLDGEGTYVWSGARRPEDVVGEGIDPELFARLLKNALAYVEQFAPDILAAHEWKRERQSLEPKRLPRRLPADHPARAHGIRGPLIWQLHEFIEEHGALPSYTMDSGGSSGRRGELALQSLAHLIGNPGLKNNRSAKSYLKGRLEEGVPLRPGMLPLAVSEVETPGGQVTQWRDEFCWASIDAEVTYLRDAAAIVLEAFTGLRSGELLSIPKTGWRTTWYGHPAITAHLIKRSDGSPAKWWVTEPALRACKILERTCPPGATTLLASKHARSDSHEDIEGVTMLNASLSRFVTHINTGQTLRYSYPIPAAAEWGKSSTSEGDAKLSPHQFRHTLAAIGNTTDLGDLALYTQFHHAAHAVTWSYMANDSKRKWTDVLVSERAADGIESALEIAAGVWSGESDLAGPAGRSLQDSVAEVLHSQDLPEYEPDSLELPEEQFAAIVADTPALAAFVRSIAYDLHLGAINHCRFDRAIAKCVDAEATLPLLARCVPLECGNTVIEDMHRDVYMDLLDETNSLLEMKNVPPQQAELLRRRREAVERVLQGPQDHAAEM